MLVGCQRLQASAIWHRPSAGRVALRRRRRRPTRGVRAYRSWHVRHQVCPRPQRIYCPSCSLVSRAQLAGGTRECWGQIWDRQRRTRVRAMPDRPVIGLVAALGLCACDATTQYKASSKYSWWLARMHGGQEQVSHWRRCASCSRQRRRCLRVPRSTGDERAIIVEGCDISHQRAQLGQSAPARWARRVFSQRGKSNERGSGRRGSRGVPSR